jgi:hypothetical protein
LGDGVLRIEGKDELDEKYFLSPKQHDRLAPPDLYDTKLFSLQSKEAADVKYKLMGIHRIHRKVVKLSLKCWENVGHIDGPFEHYLEAATRTHHEEEGGGLLAKFAVPELESYVRSIGSEEKATLKRMREAAHVRADPDAGIQEGVDVLVAELFARRQQTEDLERMVNQLLAAKQVDYQMAQAAAKMHATQRELIMDTLTVVGQEDIRIKTAREHFLEGHLKPKFSQRLSNESRRPRARYICFITRPGKRTDKMNKRHETDRLLHPDLDATVAKYVKEPKVGNIGL